MVYIVVIFTIIGCTFAGNLLPIEHSSRIGRIFGGRNISILERPYQVSIQENNVHICGGSLYKENLVISAAHCFLYNSGKNVKVRLGSTYLNSGGVVVNVTNITVHPDFNYVSFKYDIAILKLEPAVRLNSSIQTIYLATSEPSPGSYVSVSGWGSTSETSYTFSELLQEVEVQMISNSDCASKISGYKHKFTKSMICTFTPGKDACLGDSGGPLVSDGELVGIVSWGKGCAENPSVYTNIAHVRTWIVKNSEDFE